MKVHAAMNWGVPLAVVGVEDCVGGERFLGGGGSGRRSTWRPAVGSCHHFKSSNRAASRARFLEFREAGLKLRCRGGDVEQHFGRRSGDILPTLSRRPAEGSVCGARDFCHASGLHVPQLNFVKSSNLTSRRTSWPVVRCNVGVAPLEESKPDAGPGDHTASRTSENSHEKPQLLSTVPEAALSEAGGKTGSISFYARRSEQVESVSPPKRNKWLSLLWLLGPFILVASVVLPPLYLRKLFGAVLEDSLVTDFVILFFTETLFFVGAGVFLYIAHISRLSTVATASTVEQKLSPPIYSLGYKLSSKIALAVGILLPVASFVIVWPWTGPAAAAALAPYMIGLLVQLGFEQIIQANESPVWPLVPVTFQMYRLHQLNRAAQLVAGLLFSLKSVEATSETMAINGSLQTLLLVLQVLGMLCLWSLGSFLTNQLPTRLGQHSIPSLP